MKRFLALLLALLLCLGMSGVANATLFDRGGGLIYDDHLDITWLQDANYAATSGYDSDGRMNWDDALTWADQLVYQGYSDWRLPTSTFPGGYNNTTSEMGYMYYMNMGGTSSFPGMNFIDGETGETRSFQNLQHSFSEYYWSGTEYIYPEVAFDFCFEDGFQYDDSKFVEQYAWAVRPGDSAPVPEPASIILLGFGLVGLAGSGRKKFKK